MVAVQSERAHLPAKLTITLWDFTWYTRTGPGEPFEDIDRAFNEARARGYNTVRVCAMPYLLFRSGLDTSRLTFEPFGGQYGQGTRWYDVKKTRTLDGRAQLRSLLEGARRAGMFVILSSWEYQQSPSFLSDPRWFEELMAIPPDKRFLALADAWTDLLNYLDGLGLTDRVAYVELHNEVNVCKLNEAVTGDDPVIGMKPFLEKAIERMKSAHPTMSFTACYAHPPLGKLRGVPTNADVFHVHPYVYGPLRALMDRYELSGSAPFPQQDASSDLLLEGAPALEEWSLPAEKAWKQRATGVGKRLFYTHDWADGTKWDRWLYDHWGEHRRQMLERLELDLAVCADHAAARGIPAVVGEGYVGYTPLTSIFEAGPVGAAVSELAVKRCAELGYWGTVVCSNSAPHHPAWADVSFQQRLNELFSGQARGPSRTVNTEHRSDQPAPEQAGKDRGER